MQNNSQGVQKRDKHNSEGKVPDSVKINEWWDNKDLKQFAGTGRENALGKRRERHRNSKNDESCDGNERW